MNGRFLFASPTARPLEARPLEAAAEDSTFIGEEDWRRLRSDLLVKLRPVLLSRECLFFLFGGLGLGLGMAEARMDCLHRSDGRTNRPSTFTLATLLDLIWSIGEFGVLNWTCFGEAGARAFKAFGNRSFFKISFQKR